MGLFLSENEKNLKQLRKIADKVVALEGKYKAMTNSELQQQTNVLKERLNKESLDDILPDAYALVVEASDRVLSMRHFYVQIIGGIALHQGRIAEMKTGEGKTLVATLPIYLNALTGKGVHLVTVNDYLAKYQAEWMGKLYRFLGLSVGCVVPGMDIQSKKNAYLCDICYCTNNELGFDYLRDNLAVSLNGLVQRGLNFAIVDEVDSILIDEARTPLIIAGKGEESSEMYLAANKFARRLNPNDYEINEEDRAILLLESGIKKAEAEFGVDNLGDLENIELNHYINNALKACYIMKRDIDYVIQKGEVIIVDEFTGRLMIGRRFSEGLHQAIEAKEGVHIREENKTIATITFQNFFRLYKKISGMTGTAKTEEGEFRTIYGLDVVEIPTNKPLIRKDLDDVIYSTIQGKDRAIVNEVKMRHATGQPILVGTASVERSELISSLLNKEGIRHNVLNAKNHEKEAEIIAQAGKKNAVTIATNMAGRGTDILLGGNPDFLAKAALKVKGYSDEVISYASSPLDIDDEEVKKAKEVYNKLYNEYKEQTDKEKEEVIRLGGLHIVGTERHEARRIDNQLRGRSGRQGDPGSSIFYISLEDDVARIFGGEQMQQVFSLFKVDDNTPISAKMLSRSIENAQLKVEGRNFSIRKTVLQFDDVMNRQRSLIYEERNKVLHGENMHDQVCSMITDYVKKETISALNTIEDIDKINKRLEETVFNQGTNFITKSNIESNKIEDKAVELALEQYNEKVDAYIKEGIDFYDIERVIMLKNVDDRWMDHIDAMDQLRKGIGLRAYGQHDPVIAYKEEGFDMFDKMIQSIQDSTARTALKVRVRKQTDVELKEHVQENKKPVSNVKVGRNDPCPCGSGKKYKNCCGK